jgi:hypothetical protein
MSERLLPGVHVRHPAMPDWGIGQVQSVIGNRITVNFENAGKQSINGAVVTLVEIDIRGDRQLIDDGTTSR